MPNKDQLDDLIQQLVTLLPEDLQRSRQDIERNLRAVLSASLARMRLVSREEFDIQSELLGRTRSALDELEAKISALEQQRN